MVAFSTTYKNLCNSWIFLCISSLTYFCVQTGYQFHKKNVRCKQFTGKNMTVLMSKVQHTCAEYTTCISLSENHPSTIKHRSKVRFKTAGFHMTFLKYTCSILPASIRLIFWKLLPVTEWKSTYLGRERGLACIYFNSSGKTLHHSVLLLDCASLWNSKCAQYTKGQIHNAFCNNFLIMKTAKREWKSKDSPTVLVERDFSWSLASNGHLHHCSPC